MLFQALEASHVFLGYSSNIFHTSDEVEGVSSAGDMLATCYNASWTCINDALVMFLSLCNVVDGAYIYIYIYIYRVINK